LTAKPGTTEGERSAGPAGSGDLAPAIRDALTRAIVFSKKANRAQDKETFPRERQRPPAGDDIVLSGPDYSAAETPSEMTLPGALKLFRRNYFGGGI
jgi:hypothetical protein